MSRLSLLVVLLAGCSAADSGADGGSGTSAADLGNPCGGSGECSSNVCLGAPSNFENILGLCSSGCASSADCGSAGICLTDATGTFATACYRRCASAGDCLGGVPCVWQASAGSGICYPVRTDICQGGSSACVACAGNGCCNETMNCVVDVACGKDLASCAVGACLSKLASSNDGVEAALGACMASVCAGQCP